MHSPALCASKSMVNGRVHFINNNFPSLHLPYWVREEWRMTQQWTIFGSFILQQAPWSTSESLWVFSLLSSFPVGCSEDRDLESMLSLFCIRRPVAHQQSVLLKKACSFIYYPGVRMYWVIARWVKKTQWLDNPLGDCSTWGMSKRTFPLWDNNLMLISFSLLI